MQQVTRRIWFVFAVLSVLLTAISPVTAQDAQPSKEEIEATIAALETQVAEMESQEGNTPESTPTASGEWNTAAVAGNGFEVLTPAPAGTVDVIAVGTYDGQRLPFVVHNNTDTVVDDVSVDASVLDTAGGLFAVGGDLDSTTPDWVEPGGVTLGYLYFDGIVFPPGATVEMNVSYQTPDGRESVSSLEATVAEWNQVEDRFVGFLSNPHSQEIIYPVHVSVICLASDGSITSYNEDFIQSETIPVGEQVPFQVTLSSPSCEHPLIAAEGFNF